VEGTVLEIPVRHGKDPYQVCSRIGDNPEELWNADFLEEERCAGVRRPASPCQSTAGRAGTCSIG
jgi:hypothetical protein